MAETPDWHAELSRTETVLSRNAHDKQAMLDRAMALSKLNDWRSAISLWEQVQALVGDMPPLTRNIARGYLRLRDIGTAQSLVDGLLARNTDDAESWAVRGVVLMQAGQWEDAIDAMRRCAARRGLDHAENTLNLSTSLLTVGQWEEGLALYERRWPHVDAGTAAIHRQLSSLPAWQPGTETDIDLVVGSEQGIGDTIMMARFLPILAKRVRKVTAMVQAPLLALFGRSFAATANLDFVPRGDVPLTDNCRFVMSMSLLHALNIRPNTIPSSLGYLSAASWAGGSGRRQTRSRPAVGVAWQGSPGHPDDDIRSLPATLVCDFLKRCPQIDFYALSPASMLPLHGHPAPANLFFPVAEGEGLEVTAALMEEMDLVISIDSAPCHLAGALGVPVWTLLRRHADWRWGTAMAEETPWYGSMALLRQPEIGDWPRLLDKVIHRLQASWP
ncbi:hypothetical protein CHU95_11660 [Niveispirillum lacus]|uniref:Uncharacterized protein n=1 Tax=Niveispirillum lacus TaxID=1981099 RepID=A0A255YZL0_9PROT|nr:tetratricopeptide repeat protein [Niveispirillum lacus]OYQ34114.1 hypothetical protein CHU95_11660 [Niveispirillum lacus]